MWGVSTKVLSIMARPTWHLEYLNQIIDENLLIKLQKINNEFNCTVILVIRGMSDENSRWVDFSPDLIVRWTKLCDRFSIQLDLGEAPCDKLKYL